MKRAKKQKQLNPTAVIRIAAQLQPAKKKEKKGAAALIKRHCSFCGRYFDMTYVNVELIYLAKPCADADLCYLCPDCSGPGPTNASNRFYSREGRGE